MMMCAPYAWRSSLSKTLGKPHVAGEAKPRSRHGTSSQEGQHYSVACFAISDVHFKNVRHLVMLLSSVSFGNVV